MESTLTAEACHVRVFVRTRPTAKFAKEIITFGEDLKTVNVKLKADCQDYVINNKKKEWMFSVDSVLHHSSQELVYSRAVTPLVSQTFDGYGGCVMAYGQVGSGKSYTMIGPEDNFMMRGVVPRAISQLFSEMRRREDESSSVIRVSYVEIYNDKLIDLLTNLNEERKKPCALTLSESPDGRISVNGLTVKTVESEEEALNVLFEGEFHRTVSYHPLNTLSSRSHAIFTIHMETQSKSLSNADIALSKLHLVDLGGTERLDKSQAPGHVESEAISINKSLSFLEQVILSLSSSRRDHIPYRQCKLTHYLSDSLHGRSNIILLASIRGEEEHVEETISTLKFVARIKALPTDPVNNKTYDEQKLSKKYEKEIDLLKQELTMQDILHRKGSSSLSYDPLNEAQINDIHRQVRGYVEGTLPELKVLTVRQTKEVFSQLKSYISSVEKSHEDEVQELRAKVDTLEAKVHSFQTDQTDDSKIIPGRASTRGTGKKSVTYSLAEENKELGHEDGSGITVGKAPTNITSATKPTSKKLLMPRVSISESSKKKRDNKVSMSGDADIGIDDGNDINKSTLTRPSSPPPRAEAFETFKNGRGKELHAVFLQNKEYLGKKKKAILDYKQRLKVLSDKIQELQKEVEDYQEKMDTNGTIVTTDGRLVLRECEYSAIVKLKQAKSEFKVTIASLETARTEIPLCQEHVMYSRRKLLKEFESWFKAAFIGEPSKDHPHSSEMNEYKGTDNDRLQTIQQVKHFESEIDSSTDAYYRASKRAQKRARTFMVLGNKPLVATT